ncbi:MAG TPA: hypothetical protein VNC59_00880, partial [Thermoanaerobaculia bacterium]|nr:hypothetical protein [Thermoanaerobaculia bacterium]
MRRRSHRLWMTVLVCALSVSVRMSAGESAGYLYERAYFLEQGRGDLEAAIKLYRRVAEEFREDRKLAARALLRMGACYERLGVDGATQAYRAILERYADQPEARTAREKLRDFEKGREPDIPTGVTVRQIQLKAGKQLFTAGSLSPDGKSIAYYDWETLTLQVQDLRNEQTRLLSRPRVEMPHYELHWSPDGEKIA